MKKIFVLFSFLLAMSQGFAQLKQLQFEQIDSLQTLEKRNLIVFIHTDWCKYCQVMKSKTFQNKDVITTINEQFYFVELNAEDQRKISFNNATFEYKPNGNGTGVNELAIELGTIKGQISYPTLCILNNKNEIVFQYSGFLNSKDLLQLLEKLKR